VGKRALGRRATGVPATFVMLPAGGRSGSARPASRGIRQHDSLDRWDWHNHQSARGREIVYPIPHWTSCQTGVQCQRLSTRVAIGRGQKEITARRLWAVFQTSRISPLSRSSNVMAFEFMEAGTPMRFAGQDISPTTGAANLFARAYQAILRQVRSVRLARQNVSVMNSRRFTASGSRASDRKDSIPEYGRRLPLRDFSPGFCRAERVRHPVCREESHRGAERSPASRARNGAKFSSLRDGVRRIGDCHGFQNHSRSD
jgi:hypothetical protein